MLLLSLLFCFRQLEDDYIAYTNDVERRASEAVASASDFKKESPLCPICLKSELKIKEGQMQDGQNVCVDCGNLMCLQCGNMEPSVTSKVGYLTLFMPSHRYIGGHIVFALSVYPLLSLCVRLFVLLFLISAKNL